MSDIVIKALTAHDVRSTTVDHLMADMRARLERLREDNDSGDAEVTARRRGRIVELKEWLALFDQARLEDDAFSASARSALKGHY